MTWEIWGSHGCVVDDDDGDDDDADLLTFDDVFIGI
jgi:hypothetical protein